MNNEKMDHDDRINYNVSALKGLDVNDMDYVEAFNMPHRLAHTPGINEFMLDRAYEDNVASFVENGLRESEAHTKALSIRNLKLGEINGLLASKGMLND